MYKIKIVILLNLPILSNIHAKYTKLCYKMYEGGGN